MSRASLLCGVGAVLIQSVVNMWWDVPAWTLHVFFFCGFFGLWLIVSFFLQTRSAAKQGSAWPYTLVLHPESVYAEDKTMGLNIRVRVRKVVRFWGALAVEIESLPGQFGHDISRRVARVVIWRSDLNPVLYRKISVLLHWHWRGAQ